MYETTHIDAFLGLAVGKTGHHGCALSADGTQRYLNKPNYFHKTSNAYERLSHSCDNTAVFSSLTLNQTPSGHYPLWSPVIATVPSATFGLAIRTAADLHPCKAKIDIQDAFIIADTARVLPSTLPEVDHDNETLSALKVLPGYDDDIARDCARSINRLRSAVLQIHPALERVFSGDVTQRCATRDLLEHYGGPTNNRPGKESPGCDLGSTSAPAVTRVHWLIGFSRFLPNRRWWYPVRTRSRKRSRCWQPTSYLSSNNVRKYPTR